MSMIGSLLRPPPPRSERPPPPAAEPTPPAAEPAPAPVPAPAPAPVAEAPAPTPAPVVPQSPAADPPAPAYMAGEASRFTAPTHSLATLLGDNWVAAALSPEVAASEARTRAQAFAAAASGLIADAGMQVRDQASMLLGRA